MPGLRHPVPSLVGAAALLAGLVACASTVGGEAEFAGGGAPTTTSESTETTTESTETTTETTESTTGTTASGPTAEESLACTLIPLSDIDAFTAFNELAAKPEDQQTQEERDAVAVLFDSAQLEVQDLIDPLPEGPIRDAAIGYHEAQLTVRDNLTAGTDVNTQIILDEQAILESACGTG